MGKKQGQAQRVKGNLQPSSSAKAAEVLQQVASNLANYGYGSSDIAPLGVGTLLEEAFDSNLDSDFRMVLRKLYKKDALTKQKALDELKVLIDSKSQDQCITIVPYWSKCFTKLSLDNDRKIREQCQQTHERLCPKVNKSLAPHLKLIMPYWILAQSDSHLAASRIAESSFKATFNEAKQPEVVYFARDEILNVLQDYLIDQTHKTLSDMKSTSEDEALQKYETIVCICMRGLNLFLKYLSISIEKLAKSQQQQQSSESTESATASATAAATTVSSFNLNSLNLTFQKLEKLISDQKFWRFSKDNSIKIKGEFFQLLSALIDLILLNNNLIELEKSNTLSQSLRKNLKLKLVPLVFYSCEEDNSSCSYYSWQSIIKCINNSSKLDSNFWSLLNVKKAFIPKLLSLLRSHANGTANSQNIETIFLSLTSLISKLSTGGDHDANTGIFSDNDERIHFYKELLSKLNDSIFKETSTANKFKSLSASNRAKIINCLFDCLNFIFNQLIEIDLVESTTPQQINVAPTPTNDDDNGLSTKSHKTQENVQEFFKYSIENYLIPLIVSYLTNDKANSFYISNRDELDFEFKFQSLIESVIEREKTTNGGEYLKKTFWLKLNSILIERLLNETNSDETRDGGGDGDGNDANTDDATSKSSYDKLVSQAKTQLNIIKNFTNLFETFWNKHSSQTSPLPPLSDSTNLTFNLLNLVKILFSKYLNNFNSILRKDQFEFNKEIQLEHLAFINLITLNQLANHFICPSFLNSFLPINLAPNEKISTNLSENLNLFNKNFIDFYSETIRKRITSLNLNKAELTIQIENEQTFDENDYKQSSIQFALIDLFLIVNVRFADCSSPNLMAKLEAILFDNESVESLPEKLERLFEYYFKPIIPTLSTNNSIRNIYFDWFIKSERFSNLLGDYLISIVSIKRNTNRNLLKYFLKFLEFLSNTTKTTLSPRPNGAKVEPLEPHVVVTDSSPQINAKIKSFCEMFIKMLSDLLRVSLVEVTTTSVSSMSTKQVTKYNSLMSIRIDDLNKLIEFGIELLFNEKNFFYKLNDLNKLWTILIDCFRLKSSLLSLKNLKKSQPEEVSIGRVSNSLTSNLNNFISKLSNRLFNLVGNKLESNNSDLFTNIDDYEQFILFIINNINANLDNLNEYDLNEQIIFGLIEQFATILADKQNAIENFFKNILFRVSYNKSKVSHVDADAPTGTGTDAMAETVVGAESTTRVGLETFKSLFESICWSNENVLIDLLKSVYLDERLNYLYKSHMKRMLLFRCDQMDQSNNHSNKIFSWLKQLNYTFKLFNFYFGNEFSCSSSKKNPLILLESDVKDAEKGVGAEEEKFLNSSEEWWIYLILNGIILDKIELVELIGLSGSSSSGLVVVDYDLLLKLIKNVKSEFKKLLFETKFLEFILRKYLKENDNENNAFDRLKDSLFRLDSSSSLSNLSSPGSEFKFQLENLSLLLLSLVDYSIETNSNKHLIDLLNQFTLKLIDQFAETEAENEINRIDEIKFFLCELPFAKYSVIKNLNQLDNEDVQFYYDIFANLIQHLYLLQLNESKQILIQLKSDDSIQETTAILKSFNSNLSLIVKYCDIYLEFLSKSPKQPPQQSQQQDGISSSRDFSLNICLNSNEATFKFLNENLSKYLSDVLNVLIDLKSLLKDSIRSLNESRPIETNSAKSELDELNLEKFDFINKVSCFLKLFFVDYKLRPGKQSSSTYQIEQLSLYLKQDQWDFILCHSVDLLIDLNKTSCNVNLDSFFKSNSIELASIHFLRFLNPMVRCIQIKVKENKLARYPKLLFNDWNGLFSKEIYDPLLCLYVRLAEFYSSDHAKCVNKQRKLSSYLYNLSLKSFKLEMIKLLSELVAFIPFERIIFNNLEAKFNILDLDLMNKATAAISLNEKIYSINLNDSLKTLINHLVPNLKHQIASIQLSSYRVLRTLMKNITNFYEATANNESNDDDENDNENNNEVSSNKPKQLGLFESLPFVIRETLFELTHLFAEVKNIIQFDQNILVTRLRRSSLMDSDEEEIEDYDQDQADENDNEFDSIKLKEMCHDANCKLMSYLLVNRLILDMFNTNDLEFKVKLVNDLRKINFNDYLMHCLFRLMPSSKNCTLKLFMPSLNQDLLDSDEYDFDSLVSIDAKFNGGDSLSSVFSSFSFSSSASQILARIFFSKRLDSNSNCCLIESFTNRNVQIFACKLYKHSLKCVPAMIRDWWNIQPKRIADQVDKYTTKYVSPILLEEEIREVNRSANLLNVNSSASGSSSAPIFVEVNKTTGVTPGATGPAKKTIIIEDDDQSTIKVRGMLSSREIVSTYKMKELSMELVIQLPINHPLGVIEVSSIKRLGVSENEWRNWIIQLTTYLTHQNGSIIQSLQIWKRNVDKKFSGVEECTICYSVIHGTNYQLPKKRCRTCKKLFHSICLYKWFESSSKSTCPLCRNLF